MSNEELAVFIQSGQMDLLPELWENVRRFIAKEANRRMVLSAGLGGVTFEDLYQSGYLGLVAAVDSFDPEKERSFVSWLSLTLKTAFAEAGCYRSTKQSCDPLLRAGSLDVPLGEDEDGLTLSDALPDPAAELALEEVEERDRRQRLHDALMDALAELPEDLRAGIIGKY